MENPRRDTSGLKLRWICFTALAAVIVSVISVALLRPEKSIRLTQPVQDSPPSINLAGAGVAPGSASVSPNPATRPVRTPAFQQRPFAVAQESATCQWTAEDGRDTNVIRRLAHNELEYKRMVEENDRIKRRQLVYRKDTAAAVMQRARASGEPVKQLTLPGFDGQEIQFQIDRADLEPSQQSGTFTGQLPNRPNSMITLAFKFGREAFTILSPDDGLFLQAHPREPGELILTSFDPDAYQPVPGGESVKTSQK